MCESYQLRFIGLLNSYTHITLARLHGNGKVGIVLVGAHPRSVYPYS